MSIPNPLQLKIHGKRNVILDEEPLEQIGTDLDFMNLYPELVPEDKSNSLTTLSDTNTTYISNSAGNDSTGTGTYALPVKTVSKAVILAQANDAILFLCFKAATYVYVEDVYIPQRYTVYNDTSVSSTYRYILRAAPAGITDSNSYFVDFKNGSDGSAGTQTAPVKTLQKCFDLAYAATGVDKNIVILVDNTFTEVEYTTEESCELIFPSANNRKIYVLWRRGADDFTTGVGAKLKFSYDERDTLSGSYNWRGIAYNQGLFQQGSLETMYVTDYTGGVAALNYTNNGINFTGITNIGTRKPYDFGYFRTATPTDYMLLGTSAGIYNSTNGTTWNTTSLTAGDFRTFTEFNNYLVAAGDGGLYRSNDGFGTNTLIENSSLNKDVKPAVIGDYLYYYGHTGTDGRIRKVDTNWAHSTFITITGVTLINYLIAFNGYLYCLAENSTTNISYFIKINSSTDYEIIYSRSYSSSSPYGNAVTMSVIDERIYIPNLMEFGKITAFDGDVFYEIGDIDTTDRIYYTNFGFRNRYYYTVDISTIAVKYGLLDCLSIETDLITSGIFQIEGVLFDGDNKKARCNIIKGFTNANALQYCNLNNPFYSLFKSIYTFTISLLYPFKNNIFQNSKNGLVLISSGSTNQSSFSYNLFYNIIDNTIIVNSPINIYSFTFDLCNKIYAGLFEGCILSRVNEIIKTTIRIELIQCVIPLNIKYPVDTLFREISYAGAPYIDSNIKGIPIFRNRDAVNQDFPDYRLQKRWIKANNGEYYKFDSIGVDFYKYGGVPYPDSGCYNFTRTLDTDTYDYTWDADFIPNDIPYQDAFNNANELLTAAGIKTTSHTGDQNVLCIPFEPVTVDEWRTLRDLYTMIKSNEVLRIDLNHWLEYTEANRQTYATNGDLGLFSFPTVIGSGTWLAKYYADDMKIVQKETTWYDNEYKGYLVYLSWDDSGTQKSVFLKIIKNTPSTLYLEDVDGLHELPSADIDNSSDDMYCIIGSMYVKCNTKKLESQLSMWYRKTIPNIGAATIELLETP